MNVKIIEITQQRSFMKINWTGQIAKYSIENGKLTMLVMLGLFAWGVLSFFLTPKKYNPTIIAPAFQITVDYPGASREEVLEQITKPLENIISDIAGVEDIYSASFKGGRSIVNVNFFVGEDLNSAKIALNDRISSDFNLAPLGIEKPSVISIDPEEVPIVVYALKSDIFSPIELRKFAHELRDRLALIEGTSRITVHGGRKRELLVSVDEEKLNHFALSIDQIESTIRNNNLFMPAGTIKGEKQFTKIDTMSWINSPEQIKDVVVMSNDSLDIKLSQVATITEGQEEIDSYVRNLDKNSGSNDNTVLVSISKIKGKNTSDIANLVHEQIDNLKTYFIPSHVKISTVVDDGFTSTREISGLTMNLFTSIAIVILVLFFFLNLKSSLLVAISIPLTLTTVFGVAYLAGEDINRITLFALILSLGLLVDNATVVIENIARKIGEVKESTKDTFIDAVNEVGPGLFMSTVTTVIAFIPMAFISGMMGPYMGPIPFFVPAALIIAMFISYSINPWMASVLIKKENKHQIKHEDKISLFAKIGLKIMMLYRHSLHLILSNKNKRNSFLLLTILFLTIVSSFPLFKLVKFRMLPKADVDQVFIYLDLPDNSPLESTNRVAKIVEQIVLRNDLVKNVQTYVGRAPIMDFNGLFKGTSARVFPNQATIRIGLENKENRSITSENLATQFRSNINNELVKLQDIKNIKVKVIEDPPGPPVLSTFLVRVQSFNQDLMKMESKKILEKVRGISEVVDIDTTLPDETETLVLKVNHLEASRSRIAPAQIAQTLNTLYSGKVIGIYHKNENIEQEVIRIRFKKESRINEETLSKITLQNPMRINIPLSRLVTIEKENSIEQLNRENHANTIYVNAEMGNRSVTYAGIDFLTFLYNYRPVDEKTKLVEFNLFGAKYLTANNDEIKITLGGEWELTLEVFRDLMIAMAVAIVAIYLVLVAQFKSFLDPFIIMSTIPLSLAGVMPGFYILNLIHGEYFTATSMIGVIALAGIAVNNSIILLEYVNDLKTKNIPIKEALIEACSTRLRPIALTTITTVFGSMTIINDPVWAGLAWSIIFGLAMSSILILFVFPAIYQLVSKE